MNAAKPDEPVSGAGGPRWAAEPGGAPYPTSGTPYETGEATGLVGPPPGAPPGPPPGGGPGVPPNPPPGWSAPPPGGGPYGWGGEPGWRQPQPPGPQERSDAALGHYLGAVGLVGPLIMYALKGKDSAWLRLSLTEAVNFHLSVLIYNLGLLVLVTVLAVVTCGFGALLYLLLVVPWVLSIVFSIQGGAAAQRGELYQYPLTIRMLH